MAARHKILLISSLPELHYDTLLRNGGFDVVTAKSLDEGLTHWKPMHFNLVLIVVDGDVNGPMAFCNHLKQLDPNQNLAFVTGWHTYVPPSECPDDVIRREYNPALFVRRVTELSETRH